MIHKVRCEYLEVPITHKCNLSCEGCSAYANYGINREVSFIKYSEWMREVKSKLSIKYIRILGGEPFLHKELEEILRITRKLYPNASIGLCSNGLLSVGRESIFKALSECDISFHVSIHSRGEVYKRKIDKAMRYITEMMTKYGIKVTIGDNVSNWNRFYEGDGVDLFRLVMGT